MANKALIIGGVVLAVAAVGGIGYYLYTKREVENGNLMNSTPTGAQSLIANAALPVQNTIVQKQPTYTPAADYIVNNVIQDQIQPTPFESKLSRLKMNEEQLMGFNLR